MVEETWTVRVLVTEPLGGGVTGFGLKAHETPDGGPEQERFTALLKPPADWTVQVVVPVPPGGTFIDEGLQDTLKSTVAPPTVNWVGNR